MDWHFRVHQRMTDAEKRGQHRSWYVDELVRLSPVSLLTLTTKPPTQDWIRSREVSEDQNPAADGAGGGSSAAPKPKLHYLPVPDDPALAGSVCPICQEKFEMKWLDDAQEFVWMDAAQIGERVFHASCHAEATKDVKRGTPEPVLGKRKAEVSGLRWDT
jgi:pre-mRNA cleavage complex 2 protein Pcf11